LANRFDGPIPSQLSLLTNLFELSLQTNLLSGPLPSDISKLTKMQRFSVEANRLSGTLPNFSPMKNLTLLWLHDNSFSGNLPGADFWSNGALVEFYVGQNMSGNIPTEVGLATNLHRLGLSNNQLTGFIPSELAQLTFLVQLALNGNDLNGTVPSQLGMLTNLGQLYLHGNHFTGNIPSEMGGSWAIESWTFDHNNFEGVVPEQVCSLNITRLYADCDEVQCACCTHCCSEDESCPFVGSDDTTDPGPGPRDIIFVPLRPSPVLLNASHLQALWALNQVP
jgi:hypothetical protein